jgi:putative hydrolase of the HAD superfamily
VVIDVVALDGDDTLWDSENQFVMTQQRFTELLADHADRPTLDALLLDRERENLELFGYGAKGFTLSMIETAIDVTDGTVDVADIKEIIENGKAMLRHPVELLDGVDETVRRLAGEHKVMLITKGDLFHQESKLAASGLADLFWEIEIVAEKDEPTYQRIFDRYAIEPSRFVMVGNSLRSDILPVLALGGQAVHIEYETTWAIEHAEADAETHGYWELDSIRELPELLAKLHAA